MLSRGDRLLALHLYRTPKYITMLPSLHIILWKTSLFVHIFMLMASILIYVVRRGGERLQY